MVDGELISTGLVLLCVGIAVVFAGGVALIVRQALAPDDGGAPERPEAADAPGARPAPAPERVHAAV
ncbi:hypothetical protein CLV63_104267 [Murinocardiopsis flavida]|uniref:Uncharacterized protein n=1 Tax=Murinocardiopsis flavida TaxID=645275 RepID=A0A2P8DPB7_9ACTN|nr:hypothetical protein [Murinocardiopsis flavida]PSK99043.1 hypothetical protein CLV63_104267 [Murinocardiopsis flavida]